MSVKLGIGGRTAALGHEHEHKADNARHDKHADGAKESKADTDFDDGAETPDEAKECTEQSGIVGDGVVFELEYFHHLAGDKGDSKADGDSCRDNDGQANNEAAYSREEIGNQFHDGTPDFEPLRLIEGMAFKP